MKIKNKTKYCLCKEIDEVCEEEIQIIAEQIASQEEKREESFQYPPEHEEELPSSIETEVDRNVRYHRRPIISQKSYEQCEREKQTLYINVKEMLFTRPDIRQGSNVADNVKDAIATISYRHAVSVPKGRIAYQTACEKGYAHHYYLTTDERRKFEPD